MDVGGTIVGKGGEKGVKWGKKREPEPPTEECMVNMKKKKKKNCTISQMEEHRAVRSQQRKPLDKTIVKAYMVIHVKACE